MSLAPYAVSSANSKGRIHQEPAPLDRSEFQRDRDRVIHSTSFRRLEYKTQVFVNHEGDMYRTRLTHSIEVSQIARSVARNLNLNEDLTEAIALAHDLGHTPFGHAGQSALNKCMADYGGFEHNLQSIRVVDYLESKYAGFQGLNLSFELREGILKHCSIKNAKSLGELGLRFINKQQPSLEAQLVDVADAIAYNNHDVDDGLRSGLIDIDTLLKSKLFEKSYLSSKEKFKEANNKVLISETVRNMIHRQIIDLTHNSLENIKRLNLKSIHDVRGYDKCTIDFSQAISAQHLELKRILNQSLYQHPVVQEMSDKARIIIRFLFGHFFANPEDLPDNINFRNSTDKARACSDYIAGMTDRFAYEKYSQFSGEDLS